jgi:hypothetical protein
MKFNFTKISIFIILSLFIFPAFSSAYIIAPDIHVNININSQGKNALFNFTVEDYWNSELTESQDFSKMTEDFVASTGFGRIYFENNSYLFKLKNAQDVEAYQEGMPDYPIIPNFKFDNIFCTSTNPNDIFLIQENGVMFFPIKDEVIDCYFSRSVQVQTKTPVLIVPGIMGTEIFKDLNLLWPNVGRMITDIGDEFMDPLQFDESLNPISNLTRGNIIGSPAINQHFYDLLVQEFIIQGYVEGKTLFTFPYDWRYGVSGKFADPSTSSGQATNVDLLKSKIDQILAQTGATKVDVVAHSNGGLIVKKYVMDNFTADTTTHKINKAVFVGVPNTGAPKAIKALLQGDDYGVKIGPVGVLSEKEMKKISENMPVAYDLLPSENYRHFVGGFITQIDIGYGSIEDGKETDLNYQEFENYMINEKGLNQQAFDNSQNLHTQAFDDFDLRTRGVNLYAIDGCKTPTMANFLEIKSKNILGQESIKFGKLDLKTGDGTVPIQSSTNLPIDQDKKFYAINSDHGKMPSQNGVRQQIVNTIVGSNLDTGRDFWGNDLITQDVDDCQLNGVGFSVFSPVDIFVTDQNGNRLGLNENGDIINEIVGADFEMMGEHKFLFVPTDSGQTYTTTLTGTGTGTYTINVENIENSLTTQTETFSNLPVTASLTGTVNLSDGASPTTLTIKETPSSQAVVVNPGDYTQDTIAPEVIIEFDPVKKDLKFTGKDNISQSNEITITDKDDTITLTDKAGNTTEIKLKDKNRKITMKAEIKSIKYNGKLADTSKNKMAFLWLYDKNKNLKMLSQYVSSTLRYGSGQAKDYNVLAVYGGKNTTFVGKDSGGKILKTEKGLKILKITTEKGDLGWGY